MSLFGPTLAGSAGQGPSADLGDTIEQSLRFTGSQSLDVTSTLGAGQDDQTLSFWFKRGDGFSSSGGTYYLVNNTQSGGGTGTCEMALTEWSGDIVLQHVSTVSTATGKYRDPNAWYHIVYQCTSSGSKLFINNKEVISTTNFKKLVSGLFRIGKFNTGSYMKGYMADMWAVDGQALSPSSFARTNDNGVWVPKNYTGSVGTNGFHLTFDSSQANGIGHDSSGNGNHFTASGFDTADAALYSKDVYSYTGSQSIVNNGPSESDLASTTKSFAYPASNGFDGNSGYYFYPNVGLAWVWRPSTPIQNVTQIDIRCGTGEKVWYNGIEAAVVGNDAQRTFYSGSAITLTTLSGLYSPYNSGAGSGFGAIWINGTLLVDNFDNDVDYLDTPTSNYGTANPVGTTTGSFSEANLLVDTASNGTWQGAYGTFPMQSGKWYWEVEVNQSDMMIGISSNHRAAPTYATQTGEIAYRGTDGKKWNANSASVYGNSYTTGDIIGIAFDADSGTIWFSKNGTWQNSATQAEVEAGTTTNSAFTALADGLYVPVHFNVSTGGQRINYGQRSFIYTKPDGYEALNTNKLSEPTIKNGSDHFRAITAGPDQGVGTGERGGNWSTFYKSQTGSWWDPATANNTHAFDGSNATNAQAQNQQDGAVWEGFDPITVTSSVQIGINSGYGSATVIVTVDGVEHTTTLSAQTPLQTAFTGSGVLTKIEFPPNNSNYGGSPWGFAVDGDILVDSGPLAAAQAAFPNGLWWIKDRQNTNQHQLVDSVRGSNLALTCPTLGGDQAYSPPSGNSVAWCWNYDSSDPSVNGFEIITYTGNGTVGRTVSHNLGKAPDFIITKERNNTGNFWAFYHSAAGVGYGYLNDPLAYQHSSSSPVMFTATSSTDWTYDANNQVNQSGLDYVSYAWTSVPGYSAFGKYSGNQSADGVFVYTGFTPRFLLLKGLNLQSDWILLDSSRSTYNPRNASLYPNYNLNEQISSTLDVDFLSNGFKIRTNNATLNQGYDYLYVCFAENPFGGENQPPATAR